MSFEKMNYRAFFHSMFCLDCCRDSPNESFGPCQRKNCKRLAHGDCCKKCFDCEKFFCRSCIRPLEENGEYYCIECLYDTESKNKQLYGQCEMDNCENILNENNGYCKFCNTSLCGPCTHYASGVIACIDCFNSIRSTENILVVSKIANLQI